MKTDELVSMLATGAGAVDRGAPLRRSAVALGSGAIVAALAMLLWLDVNPALGDAVRTPMFWVRAAFCGLLVGGGIHAVARMSRPGARLDGVPALLAAPILALWILAGAVLLAASPEDRAGLVLGTSWAECSVCIALLSLPVFAAMIWLLRSFAPTRLRLAGAAAGFAAGAVGALVYTLHCTEFEAPFIATWYVLGMLLPAAIGAVAGPRLLRW